MPVTSLRMPSARPPEVAKIKIKINSQINSQIKSQIKSCAGFEEVGQRHLCQR
ncbi:hypothetical protein [Pseudomonas juntendi]|uniref:Uncharacterized protein n=1 Tax=Pseudomonas juntendi TaxID=2666183 RepID=A0ABZ2JG16_9PSED